MHSPAMALTFRGMIVKSVPLSLTIKAAETPWCVITLRPSSVWLNDYHSPPTHKHDIEANHHVTDSHGRIDRQRHRRPRPRHTHTQATRIAASQTRPYSQPHTTARIPRATLRHADTYTPPPREGHPRARRGAAATLALTLDAIWGYYGKTVRFCGECCSFTFSSLQRLPQRLL